MKILYLSFILLLPIISLGQGLVQVESGANWINQGGVSIVLENTRLDVQGLWRSSFIAQEKLVIRGNAGASMTSLSSSGTLSVFDLIVDKSMNGLLLNANVNIRKTLDLQSGSVDLNGNTISLNSNASIANETGTNRVFGSGSITISQNLNAPMSVNPGNIGIFITSAAQLEATTIIRTHVPVINGSNIGIYRQINVVPFNNSDLNADIRLMYFDEELNGASETSGLNVWMNNDTDWIELGGSMDALNNYMDVSGINSFGPLTMSDVSNPLPVELIFFNGTSNDGSVVLKWKTASETNNDRFEIMRSLDGENFQKVIGTIPGHGTTSEPQEYSFKDRNVNHETVFYRLMQFDFDGATEVLSDILVQTSIVSNVAVYPNPATNSIQVTNGVLPEKLIIYDAFGRKVLEQSKPGKKINIGHLMDGNYIIRMFLGRTKVDCVLTIDKD